ncbi:hypothetical protein FB565_003122 [Actinoplanes lutulentus]|uniref:Uncharacterized protein n=1 Tax=Actinoplanes lutulentus TaxID=1287878 RepID=A0A327Z1T3_9ACTN|nr:hypothetical protein [Actinoplanes lutulentus]RAK26072.1 hypothetical protein B0I29_129108 [Actinoplanes lutulentus]
MKPAAPKFEKADLYGRQKVVARSFGFLHLPLIILALLTLNTTWEILRANLIRAGNSDGFLKVSLFDLPTSASLLGVTAGLILARQQWARSIRPSIGTEIDLLSVADDVQAWNICFLNAGPGTGVIEEVAYSIEANKYDDTDRNWITFNQAFTALTGLGLVPDRDFHLKWIGAGGYPLVPKTGRRDKHVVAWFTTESLRKFEDFEFRLRIRDMAGDLHERKQVLKYFLPPHIKPSVASGIDQRPQVAASEGGQEPSVVERVIQQAPSKPTHLYLMVGLSAFAWIWILSRSRGRSCRKS